MDCLEQAFLMKFTLILLPRHGGKIRVLGCFEQGASYEFIHNPE
jgi:hypothetical protein